MDEEEPMGISYMPMYWYFLADCHQWHRFEDHPVEPYSSEYLEQSYLRYQSKLSTSSFTTINFSAMIYRDLSTGRDRKIQRVPFFIKKSCSCFAAAPVYWERFDPTRSYQLIQLSNKSDEYQTVEKYTRTDSQMYNHIISIKRIQNLDLWEFYCRKKIQLMKIHGVKHIEERRLFHGTSTRNIDSICKYNFDLRQAVKNGRVYGKGIYFAKHASHAAQYSIEGVLGNSPWGFPTKVMFLARVIVGKSTQGHSRLLKPDVKNVHQSSVDDTAHPNIFVIFDPNQIFPEYLIEFI